MNKTYNTQQKQLVQDYLKKNTNKHFTVSQLTEKLNKNEDVIGTTTVYRHLEALAKEGLVQKYKLNKHTCYQFITDANECTQHFHLKCSSCSELTHLDCGSLQSIKEHLYKEHSFTLDPVQTVFYGICAKCKK